MRQLRQLLLHVYVLAAVIAAGSVFVALLDREPLTLRQPMITCVFVAIVVVGEIFPLRWLRVEGREMTSSWAFAVGILLIESTLVATIAMAGASITAELFRHKAVNKIAFNAAQLVLCLAAAGWVFNVTGQSGILTDPSRSVGPMWIVAMIGAGTLLLAVNGVMTSTALVLSGQMSLAELWPKALISESHTDGALLALAPSVVVVSHRSILLLPLGLLIAFIIHRVAQRAVEQEHGATHDSLTDLWNRRAFIERLDATVALSDRSSPCRAVLVLDLDGFKAINDTLGHHIGDQILCEVGQRIVALHGIGQMSARLGGDEFATLLVHAKNRQEALDWAQTLYVALSKPYTSFGFPVQLTASIGVAIMDNDDDTSASLLRAADIAMYAAKRDSLGVHLRSRQETGHEIGRLNLIAELEGALERRELFVEYQPQATCATGAVFGFEALLRWQHPTLGLIPPAEFMPLAEQTELMQPITQFVLRRALADLAGWRARGWQLRCAVNVSAQNLHNPQFPDMVRKALHDLDLPGTVLELEITENAVMTKREVIRDVLSQLRELGARIVIDDFGTGYSSLSNMRHLPLDGVKIDRSFVRDLDSDHDDLVIVSSIIELARNLHLQSTAEGVESATAWQLLADLGCDNIQGYLVARPMTAARVFSWLQQYDPNRGVHVSSAPPRIKPRLQLVNGR